MEEIIISQTYMYMYMYNDRAHYCSYHWYWTSSLQDQMISDYTFIYKGLTQDHPSHTLGFIKCFGKGRGSCIITRKFKCRPSEVGSIACWGIQKHCKTIDKWYGTCTYVHVPIIQVHVYYIIYLYYYYNSVWYSCTCTCT